MMSCNCAENNKHMNGFYVRCGLCDPIEFPVGVDNPAKFFFRSEPKHQPLADKATDECWERNNRA